MAVVIETTVGDFTVDLFTDQRPQTCLNFLKLCKIKYYNWSLFHSVQSSFIAQTGDPTGTGKGGESVYGIVLGEKARYYEAEQMPKIKHDRTGLISMVNCGNNMLGSQFFITLGSELQSLDGHHCVFGEITEGLEVVLKFNEAICDGDFRPYQDIRISHTVVLEDPYDDPKGLIVPDKSPERTKEALLSDRIGADEAIDDTAGMTAEEIIEMRKDREAKARATILEIVGDLPDAEMAPPENVLFVCKLNPVTGDDELEIIFNRFGKIVGCEVIRDRQSGDSLQYAFIEFAERKSCEEAYFKMDNVLIDDRRIHVDFSQSVSKMRWRGKGKGIQYFDDKDKVNQSYGNSRETNNKNGRGKRGQDQVRDRERKCSLREESERKRHQQEHRKETTADESYRKNYRNNDRNNDRRSRDRETNRSIKGGNDSRERTKNIYNKGRMEMERRRKEEFDKDRLERNIKRDDNYRGRDRRDDNRYNNNEERGSGRDRRYREEIERNRRIPNMRRNEERRERTNDRWQDNQRRQMENFGRYRGGADGQARYRNEDTRHKNGREHTIDERKRLAEESLRDRPKESVVKEIQKNVKNKEKEILPEKHGSKSRKTKSSSSSEDSSSDSESDSSSESDHKRRNSKKKLNKRKYDTTSDDSSESDEPSSKIKKKKRHKDVSDSEDSDDKKSVKKKVEVQDKRKQKLKKKPSNSETTKKKLKVKEKKGEELKKKTKNKKTRKTRVSSSSESESSSSSSDSSESDSHKKKRKSSSIKSKKNKKSKKSRKQSESSSSSD